MKHQAIVSRNKQQGFTLIELMIVLGIAALIVAGVITMYLKSSSSQKVNDETTNLNTIVSGVRNLYSTSSNYVGLTTAVVVNAKIPPAKLVNGTTINNAFGGQVNIAPASISGGTNNAFTVALTQVGSEECTKMVPATVRSFDKVAVGATVLTPASNAGAIVTACNAAAAQTITWTAH